MIRPRIVVLATTASLVLAGVGAAAPAALAGSHWSEKKCDSVYNAWYKSHVNPKKGLTTKQSKQLSAFTKGLEKNHGCVIGG
jgi:hypothetical protein